MNQHTFEEHVKAHVVVWLLGTVAAGFGTGLAYVKWEDSTYEVKRVPLTTWDDYLRTKANLTQLQEQYKKLEGISKQNEADLANREASISAMESQAGTLEKEIRRLTEEKSLRPTISQSISPSCRVQDETIESLKKESAGLRTSLENEKRNVVDQDAHVHGLTDELRTCQAQARGGVEIPELHNITLTITYRKQRAADANRIEQRLGPHFQKVWMNICGDYLNSGCERPELIDYGSNLLPEVAYTVARLISEAGVPGFSAPSVDGSGNPDSLEIYLR